MSYLYNYFVLETCWKASCKQIISPRYYKVMNLQDDLVMNPVYKSFDILLGLCVHIHRNLRTLGVFRKLRNTGRSVLTFLFFSNNRP